MKVLKPQHIELGAVDTFDEKINPWLKGLDSKTHSDNQKILEICHVGKFLDTYLRDYNICKADEEPDFLITNGKETVGLEHQVIVGNDIKQQEGFFENICSKVEVELEQDSTLPNFLMTLYFNKNINTKGINKSEIIKEVSNVVRHYIDTATLVSNPYVRDVSVMKNSAKNLHANFGAYSQHSLTLEVIKKIIKKKEQKIATYRENSVATQWLLLVVGGVNESSFEVSDNFTQTFETSFDRIFLYEDLKNNLFELNTVKRNG